MTKRRRKEIKRINLAKCKDKKERRRKLIRALHLEAYRKASSGWFNKFVRRVNN
jgi:hypothetical protein